MKTTISIIAAIGQNRELGRNNKLLWHIPEDLKRFKQLTQNHAVIMGRKTYESIGRPLPDRINIVVTKNPQSFTKIKQKFQIPNPNFQTNPNKEISNFKNYLEFGNYCLEFNKNFFVCSSINSAIRKAGELEKKEIFVIGGGQIYDLALPYADKLYLTLVEGRYDADTFFPDYSAFGKVIYQEQLQRAKYRFRFLELTK